MKRIRIPDNWGIHHCCAVGRVTDSGGNRKLIEHYLSMWRVLAPCDEDCRVVRIERWAILGKGRKKP
jgi:hypothetical protein